MKIAKKENPFIGIELSHEKPHSEVIFKVAAGVFVRATYNHSTYVARLSRGTIGIWDSATARYKQCIQDGTHNFSNTMTQELVIPAPLEGESQAEVIERTTREAANKLYNKYRPLILAAIRDNKELHNHSLGQALELYASDYVADRSKSANLQKMYRNQLQRLANFLGEKPLKEIKRRDLVNFCEFHKGENGIEYISNFQKFLDDASFRLGIVSPCKKAFDSYFRSLKKDGKKKGAAAEVIADILPQEWEDKLDDECWAHLGSPLWAATVMVKESGLPLNTLCALKISDILVGDTDEEAYVIYKRDDLASYTNDYSFALSPFGASYIGEYLAFLEETYSSERMSNEKYLFSKDAIGEKPLTTTEITSFIRKDLSRFLFGYVGRIGLKNGATISLGVELLKNTRKKHLFEDVRFDDDRSARLFLLHLSLRGSVQADNYRSFTDTYGRRLLMKRLAQDRHGCRPPLEPPKFTRMSNRVRGDVRELHFPAKKDAVPGKDQVITVTLEGLAPGDPIEVVCKDGCYVSFSA